MFRSKKKCPPGSELVQRVWHCLPPQICGGLYPRRPSRLRRFGYYLGWRRKRRARRKSGTRRRSRSCFSRCCEQTHLRPSPCWLSSGRIGRGTRRNKKRYEEDKDNETSWHTFMSSSQVFLFRILIPSFCAHFSHFFLLSFCAGLSGANFVRHS